jgi:cyanophycin synthetase
MTPEPIPPTLKYEQFWRRLPGMGYGLRQPVMLGAFSVSIGTDFQFGPLDEGFRQICDMQSGPAPAALEPPQALAWRTVRWVIDTQLFANVPVSSRFRIGAVTLRDDGWATMPVAIPCFETASFRAAMDWTLSALKRLLTEGTPDQPVPDGLAESFTALLPELKKSALPGLNSFHFLRAADELDVPVSQLNGNIFAYGTGIHRRCMSSSMTDRTSHLGVTLAHNKIQTAQILRHGGLPVASHQPVTDVDQAIKAAEELGYPVVVKPFDQEQGRGVAAGLPDADGVRAAFDEARAVSQNILVEKHFHGQDYRLTVIEGVVFKVEQRVAGGVTGDGSSSIERLVEARQALPRFQKMLRDSGKMPLSLDTEAMGLLRQAGLAPSSVPGNGQFVALRRKNNISSGGEQIGIPLEAAHPDNVALAVRAARLLMLDFAGIDLIIPDIAFSWNETGAIICEVNSQPQVGVKTSPDIYRDTLAALMHRQYRIPAHLLIVEPSRAVSIRRARELAARLGCNAVSTPHEIWVDDARLPAMPTSGYHAARIVLAEVTVRGALCIVPVNEIAALGLPADRFDSIGFAGLEKHTEVMCRAVTKPATGAPALC